MTVSPRFDDLAQSELLHRLFLLCFHPQLKAFSLSKPQLILALKRMNSTRLDEMPNDEITEAIKELLELSAPRS